MIERHTTSIPMDKFILCVPCRVAICFWLAATGLACAQTSNPKMAGDPQFVQIPDIEKANPEQDCKKAMARGDTRFIGIMTAGLQVPGVPHDFPKFSKPYGVKII